MVKIINKNIFFIIVSTLEKNLNYFSLEKADVA